MAIAIDSSTPALVASAASTQTTAAFSPPGGSLLVACSGWEALSTNNATITMSNTGTGLTWTQRVRRDSRESGAVEGIATIYTAVCTAAQTGITVSAVSSKSGDAGGLKVFVVTGADLLTPIGAVGEGSSELVSTSITPTVYTSTSAASRAIGCASDFNATGAGSSSDVGFGWDVATRISGVAVHKAADTPAAGAGVTLNFTFPDLPRINWVAVEVNPGAPFVAGPPIVLDQTVNRSLFY